ncbi:hypothetical protein [Prosthecobacter sp.]|uniref:hypothetical protein n=1 Tax=Prosthecobacter sp. TaxID=1965333 RepID=UPI00378481CC
MNYSIQALDLGAHLPSSQWPLRLKDLPDDIMALFIIDALRAQTAVKAARTSGAKDPDVALLSYLRPAARHSLAERAESSDAWLPWIHEAVDADLDLLARVQHLRGEAKAQALLSHLRAREGAYVSTLELDFDVWRQRRNTPAPVAPKKSKGWFGGTPSTPSTGLGYAAFQYQTEGNTRMLFALPAPKDGAAPLWKPGSAELKTLHDEIKSSRATPDAEQKYLSALFEEIMRQCNAAGDGDVPAPLLSLLAAPFRARLLTLAGGWRQTLREALALDEQTILNWVRLEDFFPPNTDKEKPVWQVPLDSLRFPPRQVLSAEGRARGVPVDEENAFRATVHLMLHAQLRRCMDTPLTSLSVEALPQQSFSNPAGFMAMGITSSRDGSAWLWLRLEHDGPSALRVQAFWRTTQAIAKARIQSLKPPAKGAADAPAEPWLLQAAALVRAIAARSKPVTWESLQASLRSAPAQVKLKSFMPFFPDLREALLHGRLDLASHVLPAMQAAPTSLRLPFASSLLPPVLGTQGLTAPVYARVVTLSKDDGTMDICRSLLDFRTAMALDGTRVHQLVRTVHGMAARHAPATLPSLLVEMLAGELPGQQLPNIGRWLGHLHPLLAEMIHAVCQQRGVAFALAWEKQLRDSMAPLNVQQDSLLHGITRHLATTLPDFSGTHWCEVDKGGALALWFADLHLLVDELHEHPVPALEVSKLDALLYPLVPQPGLVPGTLHALLLEWLLADPDHLCDHVPFVKDIVWAALKHWISPGNAEPAPPPLSDLVDDWLAAQMQHPEEGAPYRDLALDAMLQLASDQPRWTSALQALQRWQVISEETQHWLTALSPLAPWSDFATWFKVLNLCAQSDKHDWRAEAARECARRLLSAAAAPELDAVLLKQFHALPESKSLVGATCWKELHQPALALGIAQGAAAHARLEATLLQLPKTGSPLQKAELDSLPPLSEKPVQRLELIAATVFAGTDVAIVRGCASALWPAWACRLLFNAWSKATNAAQTLQNFGTLCQRLGCDMPQLERQLVEAWMRQMETFSDSGQWTGVQLALKLYPSATPKCLVENEAFLRSVVMHLTGVADTAALGSLRGTLYPSQSSWPDRLALTTADRMLNQSNQPVDNKVLAALISLRTPAMQSWLKQHLTELDPQHHEAGRRLALLTPARQLDVVLRQWLCGITLADASTGRPVHKQQAALQTLLTTPLA